MSTPTAHEHPIVLFDGVCNLCDATVRFIVDRDPPGVFHFAALQSEAARRVLSPFAYVPAVEPDSVLLVENGKLYDRSTAALRIARRLGWPWKALVVFLVVPRVVRDVVYKWIARNRYRWFGKKDSCRRPTKAEAPRFLAD